VLNKRMCLKMLVQLQRMGYIEKEDMAACSGGCDCGSAKKASCCNSSNVEDYQQRQGNCNKGNIKVRVE